MKLRVLGCSGGELPGHRATSFLVDEALAIDAGGLTSALAIEALTAIDHVLLTHSHLDHVKDLPFLADLLVGRRPTPVVAHASDACVSALREHVFNGVIWPDFTRIPDADQPVLVFSPFEPGRPFRAGRHAVHPVPVAHPRDSVGFIVSDGESAVAVSGDTGPTGAFWDEANAAGALGAVLVETSFPTRLQRTADLSGHLTPATLALELRKLARRDLPVYAYHLKPAHEGELRRELAALAPHVRILAPGDELTL